MVLKDMKQKINLCRNYARHVHKTNIIVFTILKLAYLAILFILQLSCTAPSAGLLQNE